MTEGKRNIIHQLLEEYDIQSAEDIQDALKDLLGGTISDRTIIPIQKCIVIKFYFIMYIKETLLIFGSKKLNIGKVFQFASLFHPLSQKYYYSRRTLKNRFCPR